MYPKRCIPCGTLARISVLIIGWALHESVAFQMSMVASRPPSESLKQSLRRAPPFGIPAPLGPSFDLTSNLVSQLAVMAIKLRLAGHTDVDCDVSGSPTDLLLRGQVGPVTVRGKGWRSGRGLTCRAIEATVDKCELDTGRILSHRKVVLTTPAQGRAMIALNNADFGNFITHHLMQPPTVPGTTESIEFLKEGTHIDPKTGIVTFFSQFGGSKWECKLKRNESSNKKAFVHVSHAEGDTTLNIEATSRTLTEHVSRFFNDMVFELDGTFLSFRDLMVTDRGQSPSLMLALNIIVKKFPSPGIDF